MAYFNLIPLHEDVFISSLKGNKANLTYKHRSSARQTKNHGNILPTERIDTGKMDNDNHDTNIVKLKGGIDSYNITSINGEEIMHYFKHKFEHKKAEIRIKTSQEVSTYEIMMSDREFMDFLSMFLRKVSNVITYAISQINAPNEEKPQAITIIPVPSSSNFNVEMSRIICSRGQIANMPINMDSKQLFKKDLANLQKDEDFINKNKEFYQSRHFVYGDDTKTSEEVLDNALRRFKNITAAQSQELIDNYNLCIRKLLSSYYQHVSAATIAKRYSMLVSAYNDIREKLSHAWWSTAFNKIKYAKGPSIERRTQAIWDIVSSVYGPSYIKKYPIEVVEISKRDFQIKNLTNDTRLGLKNYFQPTANARTLNNEMLNNAIVIFDDNISGGATLSDIVYQAQKLGFKYIIPITFGVMKPKISQHRMSINMPKEWNY